MHPLEELGRQGRRGKKEVANAGDTCKNHGQPNTRGQDKKVAFRDVSVVEQGLPKHLVPVEGRGWNETVEKEASKAGERCSLPRVGSGFPSPASSW